jgi:nuclear transport factor 2 (NTF2) superfamily protein
MTDAKPPFPPFDHASALLKVQAAEDAWNTRDPHRVSLAYTEDSVWRNRDRFLTGRAEIVDFLTAKWERELDYALRKSLWSFDGNRIAVRFQYEWHDAGGQERSDSGDVAGGQERSDSGDVTGGQWFRSYGNELWEFDDQGLMLRREASINDVAIDEADRRYFGPRPEAERGKAIPLR